MESTNNKLIKVKIGEVYCLVDLDKEEVYSPKLRKLKPVHNDHDNCDYYRVFLDGNQATKNKNSILKMAKEGKGDPNYSINRDKNKLFKDRG